jgi:hypothetical protein
MWRDPRLWLGLVLIVGSFAAAMSYTQRLGHRTTVLVAAHNLAAGVEIRGGDVREVSVAVPADVPVLSDAAAVLGTAVQRDVLAGELLTPSSIGDTGDGRDRTLAVPIRAGHVPDLRHGSVVEVWLTPSLQGVELPGPARLIVERATVVAAPSDPDPTMDAAVSLLVRDVEVADIVQAMRDGAVDLVLIGQPQ